MSTSTHSRIESERGRGGARSGVGLPARKLALELGERRPGPSLDEPVDPPPRRPRELPEGLVDEALARARARRGAVALDELPADVRDRLSDELIDELLAGARTEEEIVGRGGLLGDLTRRLVERALGAELTEHLGYPPGQAPPGGAGNARNGTTPKTLQTGHGQVPIDQPRDRRGSFEPQLVKNGQRRFEGFDDKIVAMYARGMTTRDIEAHLREIYGASVGRDTISRVTAAVLEDAKAWQARPLEAVYPIVYLDALVVKIRDGQAVRNHACYLAVGVNSDGERVVLGMWFQRTEGAKFWLGVLTELKQRGLMAPPQWPQRSIPCVKRWRPAGRRPRPSPGATRRLARRRATSSHSSRSTIGSCWAFSKT